MVAKILVAEDNALVALSFRTMLESLGYTVIGPARTLEQALALVEEGGIDAALLDIDLQGRHVGPVADRLREMDRPFSFITGYGDTESLPAHYRDWPFLDKPIDEEQLAAAVAELLKPS